MRFTSAVTLSLAASVMAVSQECLTNHAKDIADYSDCGDADVLTQCFSTVDAGSPNSLIACYTKAGCSQEQALGEANYAVNRCNELSRVGELRKRYPAIDQIPVETGMGQLVPRATGDDCFVISTTQTTQCATVTEGGKLKTTDCTPFEIASSSCSPSFFCTHDNGGRPVCMEIHNSLDTGGVIISIVFAVAIVLGIGALTFMCCKERREHKRMAARAEATALARAQTKKQRSQEARAPLMSQQRGGAGAANPFQDQQNA